MEEDEDILMSDSFLENENESSEDNRKDRNLNKKFRKLSLQKEQNNFNNKLIKSFQSKEVKETISSLFDNFISGKTTLKRKDYHKSSDYDSEDLEEDYFEKENPNGDRKKVYKKKVNKKQTGFKKDKKNSKRAKSVNISKEKIPNKFVIKDKDGNTKYYIYHRKNNYHYDLRCKDRKCKGTGKYILETGETIVNKECSIKNYFDHNYAKKAFIIQKIEKNEIEDEDMNKEEYQTQYFKFIHINYPSLLYNDILLLMSEKHHPTKIYYTLKKFNNFKNNYNKVKNKNIQTQNYLDNIEVKGRKLLISTHKYLDNDNIQHNIKIFSTKNSMQNLTNKYFT